MTSTSRLRGGKNPQPVHLEKERMIQYRLNRQDRGVESFHVSDLQDAPEFFAAWSSASASARFVAIGFSTSTSRPISINLQPTVECSTVGTATLTASANPRNSSADESARV